MNQQSKDIKEMETIRGWWKLEITNVDGEVDRNDDATLEHIAGLIKIGFTSGEIIQEISIKTFRDLVNLHHELRNIDYKTRSISNVLKEYGYRYVCDESYDFDYSDFKGYLNLPLELLDE